MITITPENNVPNCSTPAARVRLSPFDPVRGEAVSSVIQINIETLPESFFRGLADCEAGRSTWGRQ